MWPVRRRRLLGACFAFLAARGSADAKPAQAHEHWVGSWATSQQLVEPENMPPADAVHDVTLRQIVRLSIGGAILRVHLSNAFGAAPLHIASVHIARATVRGDIDVSTDKVLSFSASPDVTVPAGAEYFSDPIAFPAAALSRLTITLHVDDLSQTGHPGSRATSYLATGDAVSAPSLPDAKQVTHWYVIAGVDVAAPAEAAAIVTLGDSITDGRNSTTDGNDRWPDVLAERLQADPATRLRGVLNQGIGGNRILLDSKGPNALARFDRDVLAQSGVRYLIVLEGVNDLGTLTREAEVPPAQHDALVQRIIAAYEQIVSRAHAHGIKAIGATILPFGGFDFYHPGPQNEADRQAVNRWIKAGHFDAVVDFDAVMRDPNQPDRLLPAYDSGDHIHPSPLGYRVMADAIPLSLFADAKRRAGRHAKR
jgi:lysophospholipase L1-like esterase